MQQNSTTEDMKTLSECLNKIGTEGYTENFRIDEKGKLYSPSNNKCYSPGKVHIVNFFRFEGASDPDENSILYVIETEDGLKGTLTDAYGAYADAGITKFIKEVEDISKKTINQQPAAS